MDFSITTQAFDKTLSDCIMIGIFEGGQLSLAGQILDRLCQGYLSNLLAQGDLKGKCGSTLLVHDIPHLSTKRVLLVGCGKQEEYNTASLVKAVKAGYNAIKTTSVKKIVDAISSFQPLENVDLAWHIKQSILLAEESVYQFTQCKSKKADPYTLQQITIALPTTVASDRYQALMHNTRAIAHGMALCKDLGNLPGNICTPTYLAEQAKLLAKRFRSLKVNVLEEKEMLKKNMGSLLSVSHGSEQPAKLITIEYYGTNKHEQPIALVGKGITFDSGGISLKPGPAMDEMKFDMCGAASVLGTIAAIAEIGAPINVVGVIPTTENLPSGSATKPGDIVTSMSGLTIEILNTDAEGRLILCDAITYARTFNPKTVIDIATLTGAMVIALGNDISGVFSRDDRLAQDLLKASQEISDHLWRMPLWEPYQELLESPFADMANVGNRTAGSITAACFLARFCKDLSWAHLDIAGTAYTSAKEKGATGRPVPLLTQYLLNQIQ